MRGPWEFEEPLCAEVGQHFFFPDKEDNPVDSKYAKSICNQCTHKIECAEWAIETVEEHGIWGGLNPRNRMAIRNRRGKVAQFNQSLEWCNC